jgi:hypothetical protein
MCRRTARCLLVLGFLAFAFLGSPDSAQAQDWCMDRCGPGIECTVSCFDGFSMTTCGDYGNCEYNRCHGTLSICGDPYDPCSQVCLLVWPNEYSTCGDEGYDCGWTLKYESCSL